MPNPIIRHKFTADPTVIVHNDTVYLYTGRDEAPDNTGRYVMREWLCFSSNDLVNWTEHPVPLRPTDFSWADKDAYASKVIEYEGIFLWYVAVTDRNTGQKAIGVAKAGNPAGPFKDAKGRSLISPSDADSHGENYDPSVLLDDNGKAYIFWGKRVCQYAELTPDLIGTNGSPGITAIPSFEEGAHIHKRNGWYYLSYGYQFPEKVAYAMSRNIHGPWEFKGILNDYALNSETNRPAIVQFKGKDYFFYHNGALPGGGNRRRSVCVDYLYYNEDGTIRPIVMTTEGVAAVNVS